MKSLKQIAKMVKDLASRKPVKSDMAIAKAVLETLSDDDVHELATMQLKEMAWNWKRHGQLIIEHQSVSESGDWMATALKNPSVVYGKTSSTGTRIPPFSNRDNRERFTKFAGNRLGEWLAKAKSIASKSGMDDVFKSEWETENVGPTLSTNNHLLETIRSIVSEMKSQIKLELTSELLSTEFAIGNGQRVTWGTATRDQHQLRIEMLLKNASANADAAARHAKAIELLESSGAQCLAKVK